jgi:hypothetical protein
MSNKIKSRIKQNCKKSILLHKDQKQIKLFTKSQPQINLEICEVMTKILNVSDQIVINNIDLFNNINPYILNCLYYLGKLQNDQDKITALYSLEFVFYYKKRVDSC